MLIDDVKIKVRAGRGGNGAVAFNNIKMNLGPTGADGGQGGSIYLEGVSDLGALIQFRYKKEITAKSGGRGKTQLNDGADGEDIVLKVPVGTVVHNLPPHQNNNIMSAQNKELDKKTDKEGLFLDNNWCGGLTVGQDFEIMSIGQKILIAKGGKGGRGNYKFRSSTNTSPREAEEGLPGQERELRLELKLIADVGFIGLPNVGKSSLLNELTNAKSKVANYPFTTLEANLGAYYELILADIPGLIEGASGGRGLGIKFLRHIERTKTIFHFISAESANPVGDYEIIRKELGAYNEELLKKTEYVFLSKADLLAPEEVEKKINTLKAINKDVYPISIHDSDAIERVEKILREIIKQKC